MAKSSPLEARLEALTREYLTAIITTIRNASFTDVASLTPSGGRSAGVRVGRPTRVSAAPAPSASSASSASPSREGRGGRRRMAEEPRERQTADKRAELRERVLDVLRQAEGPMGVRALSGELSVAADRLAAPLRELRAAGQIAKHGEKRATTYSAA